MDNNGIPNSQIHSQPGKIPVISIAAPYGELASAFDEEHDEGVMLPRRSCCPQIDSRSDPESPPPRLRHPKKFGEPSIETIAIERAKSLSAGISSLRGAASCHSSEHRERPSLIISQLHTAAAQLRLHDAILFAKEVDYVSLLAFELAGERCHDQLQRDYDENLTDSDAV